MKTALVITKIIKVIITTMLKYWNFSYLVYLLKVDYFYFTLHVLLSISEGQCFI